MKIPENIMDAESLGRNGLLAFLPNSKGKPPTGHVLHAFQRAEHTSRGVSYADKPELRLLDPHDMCSVQSSSVAQSCPTLCDPMDYSTPGFPVHHQFPEVTQTHVHESVMQSNHLILCRPLLLLPSIFPSIRIFSNESVLRIKWPKYWNFSFCICPSNEHSGLISFRMDWLDLLAV